MATHRPQATPGSGSRHASTPSRERCHRRVLGGCCITDGRAMVLGAELHDGCRAWCEESGEWPMSGTRFRRRMTLRGIKRVKRGQFSIWVSGWLNNAKRT